MHELASYRYTINYALHHHSNLKFLYICTSNTLVFPENLYRYLSKSQSVRSVYVGNRQKHSRYNIGYNSVVGGIAMDRTTLGHLQKGWRHYRLECYSHEDWEKNYGDLILARCLKPFQVTANRVPGSAECFHAFESIEEIKSKELTDFDEFSISFHVRNPQEMQTLFSLAHHPSKFKQLSIEQRETLLPFSKNSIESILNLFTNHLKLHKS